MRSRAEWENTALILAFMVSGHLIGLARTPLPAPDGLIYLRVARDFQTQPWHHVVQDTDRHPLYPALVASLQPFIERLNTTLHWGCSPTTLWRISGQMTALAGWVVIATGLIALGRLWFGRGLAPWIVAWVGLTPVLNTMSHDTLADSWMVGSCIWAWWLFNRTISSRHWYDPAIGFASGWLIGAGYAFKPDAILMAALILSSVWMVVAGRSTRNRRTFIILGFVTGLTITCGSYTLVKGTISEKLSVRLNIGLNPMAAEKLQAPGNRSSNQLSGWTPKEERDANPEEAAIGTILAVISTVLEATGIPGALAILIGSVWFSRIHGRSHPALLQTMLGLAIVILAQSIQYERLHYLSERHAWLIGALGALWSAWVTKCLVERFLPARMPRIHRSSCLLCGSLLLFGFGLASRGEHLSRVSHVEAATWLQTRLDDYEQLFDSRGFTLFLIQRRDYDAWHLTQALTDRQLRYMIFQRSEVEGTSDRSEAIRRLLADRNAAQVASFAGTARASHDVLVYRLAESTHPGRPILNSREVAQCDE